MLNSKYNKKFYVIVPILIILLISGTAQSIPKLINYQGYIKPKNIDLMDEQNINILFSIYNQETGGEAIWYELHENIVVTNGLYNVLLGSIRPISSDYLTDNIYLGIKINDESEMSPRKKITSSFFAISSEHSEQSEISNNIVDNSITGDKIVNKTITGDDIADGSISYVQIIDGPDSNLNADTLDNRHAEEFALKSEIPSLDQNGNFTVNGIINLKLLKPNIYPKIVLDNGSLYGRLSGVDFKSKNSIINGLVLYWKMDEQDGIYIYNSVTSQRDGVAHNNPAIEKGRLGNARNFDSAKSHYISRFHSEEIDFGKNDFTVIFWMKADTPTEWCVVASKASNKSDSNSEYGWYFGNTDIPTGTKLEFTINSGGSGRRNTKTATSQDKVVFDDQWHQIVGMKKGTDIHLYVDGVLKDSEPGISQPVSTDLPLLIGALNNKYFYNGLVDEFAIWNRALTENEITSLYNNNHYEGIPHQDGGLFYIPNNSVYGEEHEITDIDNRQEVFRLNTGSFSINNTEWNDFTNAKGEANIRINKRICWMLTLGGHYVDSSDRSMDFRLKLYNPETTSTYYLPDEQGARKNMYINNSRLEEFTMNGINKIPKGKYDVQLQVKSQNSHTYSWNSAYGNVVFMIW